MGIESMWGSAALALVLALGSGCAQAQKAAGGGSQWFDGQGWVQATDQQGAGQAAGGVVVMVEAGKAAALQAALAAKGLNPRPLAVAGAYEVATPPGADALLLTHRLADLPLLLQAPVQVAPNWQAGLKRR